MKSTPPGWKEIHEVLTGIVRRLNAKGWHGYGCAVHPTYRTYTGFGAHGDEEPELVEGGPCNCGATALVESTNKLLAEVAPGQFDLDLGGPP